MLKSLVSALESQEKSLSLEEVAAEIMREIIRNMRFPGWRGYPGEGGKDIPQVKEDYTVFPLTLKGTSRVFLWAVPTTVSS